MQSWIFNSTFSRMYFVRKSRSCGWSITEFQSIVRGNKLVIKRNTPNGFDKSDCSTGKFSE